MRRDVRALWRNPLPADKRKAMIFRKILMAAFACIALGELPAGAPPAASDWISPSFTSALDAPRSVASQMPAEFFNARWFCIFCGCAVAVMLWRLCRARAEEGVLEERARAAGMLEERARIARELHDTLIQGIHALILTLQASAVRLPNLGTPRREIDLALDRIETLLDEARAHIAGLRVSMLPLDVARAISNSANMLLLARFLDFRLTVTGESRPLRQQSAEHIYCIAREALRNAFAHAEAKTIEVQISYREKDVVVYVRDDGCGFGSASAMRGDAPGHFGIEGMRERAMQIGAELSIWSGSGAGTEVVLRVPASSAYLPAVLHDRLPPAIRRAADSVFSIIRPFLSPARNVASVARRYGEDHRRYGEDRELRT